MLKITYAKNTGGAFGIGEGNVFQVMLVNIIVLGIVGRFLILQFNKMNKTTKVILCLVLAGGFSNLLDRIIRGFVVDYIDIAQLFSFPIFNLADVYVVAGWAMLVLITLFTTLKDLRGSQSKITM